MPGISRENEAGVVLAPGLEGIGNIGIFRYTESGVGTEPVAYFVSAGVVELFEISLFFVQLKKIARNKENPKRHLKISFI